MNYKGFGRKQMKTIQGIIPAFAQRDYGKPENISVMIANSLAEIQNVIPIHSVKVI